MGYFRVVRLIKPLSSMNLYEFVQGRYQFAELAVVREPTCILKGKYCEVKCYQLSTNQDKSTWYLAPNTLPVGNPFQLLDDDEWITNAISSTPNMDFFVNFTSFDQVHQWVLYRDYCAELALAFWSEQGIQNTYLSGKLQNGDIDQFSYDYFRTEVKIYKSLWEILKAGEQRVIEICKKNWSYPFDSVRELLVEAIREDLEGEFIACLKKRYLYKSSEVKQIAKLKQKVQKGNISRNESKKLERLINQYVPFPTWINRILLIAETLATEDDVLEQYVFEYHDHIDNLAKLQIQRDCDPKLRHHLTRSHSWENGQHRGEILPWNI